MNEITASPGILRNLSLVGTLPLIVVLPLATLLVGLNGAPLHAQEKVSSDHKTLPTTSPSDPQNPSLFPIPPNQLKIDLLAYSRVAKKSLFLVTSEDSTVFNYMECKLNPEISIELQQTTIGKDCQLLSVIWLPNTIKVKKKVFLAFQERMGQFRFIDRASNIALGSVGGLVGVQGIRSSLQVWEERNHFSRLGFLSRFSWAMTTVLSGGYFAFNLLQRKVHPSSAIQIDKIPRQIDEESELRFVQMIFQSIKDSIAYALNEVYTEYLEEEEPLPLPTDLPSPDLE